MNVVLRVLQIRLAVAFAIAGLMKPIQPKEQFAAKMADIEEAAL